MTRRRLLILCAALVVFAGVNVLLRSAGGSTTGSALARGDVALFLAAVDHMRNGRTYYDAMGAELRARHYPARQPFNWRQPLLYRALATIPTTVSQLMLVALAAVLMMVSIRSRSLLAPLWMAHALMWVFVPDSIYMTELWAGVLLGLSAVAYTARRRIASVALAIAALAVRELAAPYCVALTLLAVWRRDWREVRAWSVGAILYGGYYAWHAWQVYQHVLPSDRAHHASWLVGGGITFLLRAVQSTGLVFLLVPLPVFALFVATAITAWWSSSMPTHVRLGVLAYAVFFTLAGLPFNVYWGLMLAPLMALWMAYVPSGMSVLWHDPAPIARFPWRRVERGTSA